MALRITYKASVSFEHDTAPVLTHREPAIVAPNARQAASQAIRLARRAYPNQRPRSLVLVLEEVGRTTIAGKAPPRPVEAVL